MRKTKFITVRLDEELYHLFTNKIKTNLLNGAAVIRELLRNYIDNGN